ncbi:MAG: cyclic nucleotide-binding protein [Proteobacteria bacterium]|nr:MAG: cyclic nucleotide-binding protein [Pseudomonadota bacterium]PIE40478.1 MAG: cyclic nucleotide-binding protein [Gammaproteobacteria bacterium]
MQTELLDIRTFLSDVAPFRELPDAELEAVVQDIEITYFKAGTRVIEYGQEIHDLFIVRSGSVEVFRRTGELYNRLEKGEIFGQIGLLMNNLVKFPVHTLEDTLLYCVPEKRFKSLMREYDFFSDFMEVEDVSRLRQAVSSAEESSKMTSVRLDKLHLRPPLVVSGTISISEAAAEMAEHQVSALLVNQGDDEEEFRIVTQADLCTKALATGLSPDLPIDQILSDSVVSLDHKAYIYDAVLMMLRHQSHHIPVVAKGRAIAMVEMTDLLQFESQNSLLLVNSIFQQTTVEELAELSGQVKTCFVRLVHEDANSHMIGSAMSVIGCSFKQRLLELAEQQLGPAPVPYCFLALGSMARDEQLIITDQDNALILDERYREEIHGDYFRELSGFVCDGLNLCGYPYCQGLVMATNPKWRLTRSQWRQTFSDWIENPDPQALLNCSIFFDLHGVAGKTRWAEELNSFVVQKAKNNKRFLACLARNALKRTPPLGFFKTFVMEKDGKHNNSVNLKRRGTAPLADLIRVHALASGSRSRNSFERLDDVIENRILPDGKGPDIRDAMELISMVRIRHQAKDIEDGITPDNNIEPEHLSSFERRHLKDAFQVLSQAQNFLKYRYHSSAP